MAFLEAGELALGPIGVVLVGIVALFAGAWTEASIEKKGIESEAPDWVRSTIMSDNRIADIFEKGHASAR